MTFMGSREAEVEAEKRKNKLLHCISSSPGLRVGKIDPLLFADRLPRSLHRNRSGNRQPIVLFWVISILSLCPNGVINRRHHAEIPIGAQSA